MSVSIRRDVVPRMDGIVSDLYTELDARQRRISDALKRTGRLNEGREIRPFQEYLLYTPHARGMTVGSGKNGSVRQFSITPAEGIGQTGNGYIQMFDTKYVEKEMKFSDIGRLVYCAADLEDAIAGQADPEGMITVRKPQGAVRLSREGALAQLRQFVASLDTARQDYMSRIENALLATLDAKLEDVFLPIVGTGFEYSRAQAPEIGGPPFDMNTTLTPKSAKTLAQATGLPDAEDDAIADLPLPSINLYYRKMDTTLETWMATMRSLYGDCARDDMSAGKLEVTARVAGVVRQYAMLVKRRFLAGYHDPDLKPANFLVKSNHADTLYMTDADGLIIRPGCMGSFDPALHGHAAPEMMYFSLKFTNAAKLRWFADPQVRASDVRQDSFRYDDDRDREVAANVVANLIFGLGDRLLTPEEKEKKAALTQNEMAYRILAKREAFLTDPAGQQRKEGSAPVAPLFEILREPVRKGMREGSGYSLPDFCDEIVKRCVDIEDSVRRKLF